MRSIAGIIYLVIGIFVAAAREYLGEINGIGDILNLLLAILLWPLVLLGVKFNLRLGGDGDGDRKDALQSQALVLLGPGLAYARAALASVTRRASQPEAEAGSDSSLATARTSRTSAA